MNPIYFIVLLSTLLGINFLLCLGLIFWAAVNYYYSPDQFLNRILLVSSTLSVVFGLFWEFFSKNKLSDFKRVKTRINSFYMGSGVLLCLFTSVFFFVGLWWDISNIVLGEEIYSQLYFLIYQLVFGGALGKYLFDIFTYVESLKIASLQNR